MHSWQNNLTRRRRTININIYAIALLNFTNKKHVHVLLNPRGSDPSQAVFHFIGSDNESVAILQYIGELIVYMNIHAPVIRKLRCNRTRTLIPQPFINFINDVSLWWSKPTVVAKKDYSDRLACELLLFSVVLWFCN